MDAAGPDPGERVEQLAHLAFSDHACAAGHGRVALRGFYLRGQAHAWDPGITAGPRNR
jgi:hypothetical protein